MLPELLSAHRHTFFPVVPFESSKDKVLKMDFTAANQQLTTDILNDTTLFSDYVNAQLNKENALYGIGGYAENRTVYSRSEVFNTKDEPRRLHLGIDIWGKANTPVYAPFGGMVHSFAFNSQYGDYGATIILLHQLEGFPFYTLYGHLRLQDLEKLYEGYYVSQGQQFAGFGNPEENGHWPPHLHFQIIIDIEFKEGDYPGVCKLSEKEKYLANCPNPDLILNMMQYAL